MNDEDEWVAFKAFVVTEITPTERMNVVIGASIYRDWLLARQGQALGLCQYHTGHGDCLQPREWEGHGERPRGTLGGLHRYSRVPTTDPWAGETP